MTPTSEPVTTYRIHADGSCLGNPGPGGWSYNLEAFVDGKFVFESSPSGAEINTTNSRMELQAVLEALRMLSRLPGDAVVYTDSRYLVDGATTWRRGWKTKGWRRADGKPVANGDLWIEIDDLLELRPVEFRWTKAHSGVRLNEKVDGLARAAAESLQAELRELTADGEGALV